MNEEERADWLARAIDGLFNTDRQSEAVRKPPAGLEVEELQALMRVAKARLNRALEAARAGLQYEGTIWQEVLARLNEHLGGQRPATARRPSQAPEAAAFALEGAEDEDDGRALGEVVLLRRRMAEEAALIAESHREEVWRRVQSRLQAPPEKTGAFSFLRRLPLFRRPAPRAEPTDSETLDELILLARSRKEALSQATQTATERGARPDRRPGSWARGAPPQPQQQRRRIHVPVHRLVFGGAIAALIAAAVGPIPATGLAGHPAAEFVRYLGDHVAVSETTAPPAATGRAAIAGGVETSARRASPVLGFTVVEPSETPTGFTKVSSLYFEQAITANEGGMFALVYEGAGASVAIYQEGDSGSDIAADGGAAFDVTLVDGTAATYVEGTWSAGATRFGWDEDGAQALVFERGGVRTIIRYAGPRVERAFLFEIANGMTPEAGAQTP